MSDDFETDRADFIRRSGSDFSGYSRADVPFFHPASVRRGRGGVPAPVKKPTGVAQLSVALILLFGAVAFFLTFDSLLPRIVLLFELALPVLIIVAVVSVRRKNRRRLEEMD
ncbi:MAG TPA: hypothetical protein VM841_03445 [Actinomycetota bacterium]|nr:hypothetical protein [Actinomycetota bacterium]